MNMVTVASPVLKVLFDRLGRVDVFNMPSVLQEGGPGAVIVCNHVGWADSLWLAYALYPRQLRFLSKQELFDTLHCHRPGGAVCKLDQNRRRSFAARRGHLDLPQWNAPKRERGIQARRGDHGLARTGANSARLLSGAETDAGR
jgi:Acyltransferase